MSTAIQKFSETAEGERLLRQERFIVEVTEGIIQLMKERAISRKELAELLGKSKGRISQLLDGEANLTLRTLSDIYAALGHRVVMGVEKPSTLTAIYQSPLSNELLSPDSIASE